MNKKRLAATLIPICCVLMATSIVTTTAWFVGTTYLQVGSYDIAIGTKEFLISTEPDGNFQAGLTKEDLEQVDYFVPCTTAFSDIWVKGLETEPIFRTYDPNLSSYDMTNISHSPKSSKGYFSQDLYLKASSDAYAFLSPDETKILPDYDYNRLSAERLARSSNLTADEIYDDLNSIVKSLRISILSLNDVGSNDYSDYKYAIFNPYMTDEQGNVEETYYSGPMDLDSNGYYDVFDGREVMYGQVTNSDEMVYKPISQSEITPFTGRLSCFNAKHEDDIYIFDEVESAKKGVLE